MTVRIHSEGRVALLRVAQTTTQAAIAVRVGVTEACVSWWCSGRKRPGKRARAGLQDAYGIDAQSWGPLPAQWATREHYRTPRAS